MNTSARLIVSDRLFFKAQAFDAKIRTITTFVTIRDLRVNKHKIDKYALVLFYIIEKNNQENKIRIIFRRKVYLINDLKANILIEINIINLENIIVDLINCIAKIESCKVIILIEIRILSNVIFKFVYFKKLTIISSQSKFPIEIYYFVILKDRNFLFESNKISYFTNYAYLINVTTKTIVLKNNTNRSIYISRNYCLSKLSKIKYSNAFYLDAINKTQDLFSRQSKLLYQSS